MTRSLDAVHSPAHPYGSVERDDAGFLRTNQTLLWYPTPQAAIAAASKSLRGMVVIGATELRLLLDAAERLRNIERGQDANSA